MDPDFAQRRRFAIAAAVTVIAVPAVVLLSRPPADGVIDTATTLVGTVAPAPGSEAANSANADGSSDTATDRTDPLGTTPIGYLEGTIPRQNDDIPTIAIPRPQDVETGSASFSRDLDSVRECYVPLAPFGSNVTVKNLDNSRSVQCTTEIAPFDPPADVVLHADAFAQIADVTDAPIHVEFTWCLNDCPQP